MKAKAILAPAAVLAMMWPLVAADALAQEQPAAPAQAGQTQGQGSTGQGSAPAAELPLTRPVMAVTGVEVMRSSLGTPRDVIRVSGVVPSGHWGMPHLIPLSRGVPADGILDLVFVASAPTDPAHADRFMTVDAVLPVAEGHPYKGVRIRSATNALTLKTVPGAVTAPLAIEDCGTCVGKLFVAKGATPPANVPAAEIVREEKLTPFLRVIKANDGIPHSDPEPNRLTLLLGENGRILDAAWD